MHAEQSPAVAALDQERLVPPRVPGVDRATIPLAICASPRRGSLILRRDGGPLGHGVALLVARLELCFLNVVIGWLPPGASCQARHRARSPEPPVHSGTPRQLWQPTSAPPRGWARRQP